MLHDRQHIAIRLTNDPAITGGSSRSVVIMAAPEPVERQSSTSCSTVLGRIIGQSPFKTISMPPSDPIWSCAAHQRVPGSQLFFLMNGTHTRRFSNGAHRFRLMAHHDENPAPVLRYPARGIDRVFHQGLAACARCSTLAIRDFMRSTLATGQNHNSCVE